jgi:magnesium-transporting ATPase (P-type)
MTLLNVITAAIVCAVVTFLFTLIIWQYMNLNRWLGDNTDKITKLSVNFLFFVLAFLMLIFTAQKL